MSLLARPAFRWVEPRDVRREREAADPERTRWHQRLPLMLFILVPAGVAWYLIDHDPIRVAPDPAMYFALSAAIGVVVVYAVPLLLFLGPSRISVSEGGITQMLGRATLTLPFDQLRAVRITERRLICDHHGTPRVYGLAEGVDRNALIAFLREQGVGVETL